MQREGRLAPYLFFIVLCGLSANIFAASEHYAFGVNGEDFSLSTYSVGSEGQLRHLGHRPIDKAPSSVVVDPSGQFIVAVSNTTDRLMVFRLDASSGELQPVPGSPFATGTRSPFSVRFHPSGRFLYVGARFSGVGAFSFDPQTGAIKALPGSPVPAQRRTREVAIHPSGKFLYASNGYSNSVSAYAIDENTGSLTELRDSPYSVGEFGIIDYSSSSMFDVPPEAGGLPHAIDMDPQGRFIFVPNKAAGSISVFRIDGVTGGLNSVSGSPFFVGFNPYRSRVHPSGRFVLTALWADGKVAVQSIHPVTGQLTAVAGSPFDLGSETPVELTFNADGSQVYVSNYDSNEIALLDMDLQSGKLGLRESLRTRLGPWSLTLAAGESSVQPVQQTLFATGATAGLARLNKTTSSISEAIAGHGDAVAVAPDGRYVYVLDTIEGSIRTFAIDPRQGVIAAVPNGIVKTGVEPTDLAIDINGWYLYVTNSGDASLSTYFLDPVNGIPQPVRGSPRPTGKHPVAVALDAAARFAFVVNAGSNNVSVYRYLNNVTPLIFEGKKYGSPFVAGEEPRAVVVDPTGHFVYVANAGSGDVSAFHLHHKTGALNAMPGSPFQSGTRPVSLAMHPDGRHLFVANAGSRDITVFAIEAGLGALAKRASVALPVAPKALWLTPQGGELYVLAKQGDRLLRYRVDGSSGGLSLLADQRLPQRITSLAPAKTP